MKDRKGIGGRPREGERAKTEALSFRTDADLFARVVAFQEANHMSRTQALERLLRRGLDTPSAD